MDSIKVTQEILLSFMLARQLTDTVIDGSASFAKIRKPPILYRGLYD